MDHNRYGLDGLPLSCRPANTDPVTGQPLPTVRQSIEAEGNPYVLPVVLACMAIFLVFFAYEAHLFS